MRITGNAFFKTSCVFYKVVHYYLHFLPSSFQHLAAEEALHRSAAFEVSRTFQVH